MSKQPDSGNTGIQYFAFEELLYFSNSESKSYVLKDVTTRLTRMFCRYFFIFINHQNTHISRNKHAQERQNFCLRRSAK